jgi:hypothetical protein
MAKLLEEAASIVAPQVPADAAVDVADAPNAATQTQGGVSDRRAQGGHFTGPHSPSKPRRVAKSKSSLRLRR